MVVEGGPGTRSSRESIAHGPFVAVFSSQERRPDDCHIIPTNGGNGIERGGFIKLEGILWRKDAAFTLRRGPRILFDEDAAITSAVEGPKKIRCYLARGNAYHLARWDRTLLSASTIVRLKDTWAADYARWWERLGGSW